jgi:hypothetical protein
MSDNVSITAGSGVSVAADDIGGIQYQRVKISHGADGSATDASNSSPLPITQGISGVADARKTVTTAGTRVALVASSTPARQVFITALSGNTGIICVGGSTVVASLSTRTGVPLSAGDTLAIDVADLAAFYIDSTVNGEGVSFLYLS